MVLIVILGVILLGVGFALLIRVFAVSSAGGTADTIGQIESYGFSAQATRSPGASEAQRPMEGFAAQLGRLLQSTIGVGEHGIRRDLLAAGMYETDPLTIVGYRAMAA